MMVVFNDGERVVETLFDKDWIIRFVDGSLELTLRAYRNPSDAHMLRRGRKLLREQKLNDNYVLDGVVLPGTELFLGMGLCESRSLFATLKRKKKK